jgi:pyruvyl transferase EpsI
MSGSLEQPKMSFKQFLFKLRRKAFELSAMFVKGPANLWFAYSHRKLKHQRKLLYALTPPPHLTNIGDHAQTLAIRIWFKKHFSAFPVIELDKWQSQYYLPALKWLTQPDDIVVLQSGGNMGERGMWTERIRRLWISEFFNNQIVSLPQSIQFSDTPYGIEERETTRQIYAMHPNLTVIARDPMSETIAKELFPNAIIFGMPDFVLALPSKPLKPLNNPPHVLLCLRHDNQSILSLEKHKQLVENLPYSSTLFDTEVEEPIALSEQEAVVEKTLQQFYNSDVVVTDRFHGLIFSIVCRKPCVVLPTVDHKLTYGINWFKDLPFVRLAQTLEEIPLLVEQCLASESRDVPDWHAEYFDKIPALVGLMQTSPVDEACASAIN